MWMLFWKKYKLSKLATCISVIGALTRYGGVLCIAEGLIAGVIGCFAVGIAMHFLAEQIAFNAWKEKIQAQGYEIQVTQGNLQFAIQLYNSNPCEKTLKYFETLNPQAAAHIRATLAESKQSK